MSTVSTLIYGNRKKFNRLKKTLESKKIRNNEVVKLAIIIYCEKLHLVLELQTKAITKVSKPLNQKNSNERNDIEKPN